MNPENPFALENICKSLLKKGLISIDQKEEIFRKESTFQRKFDRTGYISGSSRTGNVSPVTIIDRIAALKIERWDDPEKVLDEDIIYQCLAEE